jgi:hypothetical protein
VVDPQTAAQFPGAALRPIGGSLHGVIVEGHMCCGA